MKVIVNSLSFASFIDRMLAKNAQSFAISDGKITFFEDEEQEYIIDDYPLEYRGDYDTFRYVRLHWYRLAQFLKNIHEQPVTIEIVEDGFNIKSCEIHIAG